MRCCGHCETQHATRQAFSGPADQDVSGKRKGVAFAFAVTHSYRMTFRDTLRGALETKNMTGRELARRVDVAPSTVSRWLSGSEYPRDAALRKVAKSLGIPLDDLIVQIAAERPVRSQPWTAGKSSNRERLAKIEETMDTLEAMVRIQGETLESLRDALLKQTRRATAKPKSR